MLFYASITHTKNSHRTNAEAPIKQKKSEWIESSLKVLKPGFWNPTLTLISFTWLADSSWIHRYGDFCAFETIRWNRTTIRKITLGCGLWWLHHMERIRVQSDGPKSEPVASPPPTSLNPFGMSPAELTTWLRFDVLQASGKIIGG